MSAMAAAHLELGMWHLALGLEPEAEYLEFTLLSVVY